MLNIPEIINKAQNKPNLHKKGGIYCTSADNADSIQEWVVIE